MIGVAQSEMEVLWEVAFICLFLLKSGSSGSSAARINFSNTASLDFMSSSKLSLKNPAWHNHPHNQNSTVTCQGNITTPLKDVT